MSVQEVGGMKKWVVSIKAHLRMYVATMSVSDLGTIIDAMVNEKPVLIHLWQLK